MHLHATTVPDIIDTKNNFSDFRYLEVLENSFYGLFTGVMIFPEILL